MSTINLPEYTANYWSEVLSGVAIIAIPYNYINSVTISFKNKKIWNIDVDKSNSQLEFEDNLNEMLYNYQNHINNIDFDIDVLKVKHDVESLTQNFLLRYNL